MKKKKLAMVIAHFHVGGGQKVVLDLLKAMDMDRYQVKLFVHEEKKENQFTAELDALGICTEYVKRQRGLTLGNYQGLAKALNAYAPDVIHIHLDTVYAPIWALLHKKVQGVFTLHSQAHRAFDSGVLRKLHRTLARRKGFTLCACSRTIAREAETLLGLEKDSVPAVYNPVDVGEYSVREDRVPIRFVHVARFNPVKNHRLLLEAFAQLCQARSDCLLYLAGDGKEKENCEEFARQLGIWEQVRFLGNVLDVKSLLQDSDVFVLSSDSEAMPISVLEAMAQGLPIVSTAVGGVPELIDGNGILAEKKNAKQLAEAMEALASDSKKRADFGARSYELAQQFRTDRIIGEYEKLYG